MNAICEKWEDMFGCIVRSENRSKYHATSWFFDADALVMHLSIWVVLNINLEGGISENSI